MENFLLLENDAIQLNTGVFAGVDAYSRYPAGELLGVRLREPNMLVTHVGELVPAYTETMRRKSKFSVEFHKNGMVKAVALNEQTEIETPIGEFPAELVTFYDTGELHRFFPLDGKISGFWSEEEERALGIPFSFDLGFTRFTAILSGVCFCKSGDIRSVTLFPGETAEVETRYGVITARHGFSLYESGALQSVEPNEPTVIQTPIGAVTAFDTEAVGVSADENSLAFDERGRVTALITVHSKVAVQTGAGELRLFSPTAAVHPLDDDAEFTKGIKISFDYAENAVTLTSGGETGVFSLADCNFHIESAEPAAFGCSPSDCAGCSGNCGAG
ncbi:MAG: hypothetical protein LBN00_00325 [Oscillospiraceae bacterium]|jgi:hypothetical protein|nr:hypothetical protein [Oscillospiraceae bacterium]